MGAKKYKKYTISLPIELRTRVEVRVAGTDQSIQAFVAEALEEKLAPSRHREPMDRLDREAGDLEP